MNQSLSYAQHSVSALYGHTEPEVQITPATPSLHQSRRERQQADDSSKFTTMARGLAREIEAEADAAMKRSVRQAAAEATPRAAYHHSTIPARKHQHQRSPLKQMVVGEKSDRMSFAATPFRKSVQLPDVTGLTSAVASPAKVDVEFYGYDPRNTTEAEGMCEHVYASNHQPLTPLQHVSLLLWLSSRTSLVISRQKTVFRDDVFWSSNSSLRRARRRLHGSERAF